MRPRRGAGQRWARVVPVALAAWLGAAAPVAADPCADLWEWVDRGCRRVVDTYDRGGDVLLLSGFAWHTPWTWTAEKRAEENELAWGAGWGRMVERDNGDTDTVFALVFSDSHRKPEYNLGYAWSTYWGPRGGVQAGLGYTALVIARSDIANGFPFPAVLPLFSLRYDRVTLVSTYIPTIGGGVNHGSVLYAFAKIAID